MPRKGTFMRLLFQDKTDRRPHGPSWAPLLVLGLSVIASVALISACMAMLSPEGDAALHVSRAAPSPGAALH